MNKKKPFKGVLFLSNNENTRTLFEWLCLNNETVTLCSKKITLKEVEELKPEIIISYNYAYLINQEIISHMQGRIFNLHISYLPWNKGSNPNFWSFIDNTPKGVTIHRVDAGLDTGEIICQKLVELNEEKETFRTSYNILHNEITELFKKKWNLIKNNAIKEKRQESQGTYHTLQEYEELTNKHPLNWDDNIVDYKRRISGWK